MRPLTEEEVATYLEVFDLREKLIARLAIFEGLAARRDSGASVEGARRRHPSGGGARLQTRSRTLRRTARSAKVQFRTEHSRFSREWADLAEDPSPDGFVFPSEKLTTPLSLDNLWRRSMQPKLEKVGLDWATFQVLRKTNASLSKKAGVDPKVASDQRGHGLGVSMEVYTSSDMEQKRAAVKKLEAAVLRKPPTRKRASASKPGLME